MGNFYDHPTSQTVAEQQAPATPTVEPERPATPDEADGAALFGKTDAPEVKVEGVPENIAELRKSAGAFFDTDKLMPDTLREIEEATADVAVEGITPEQRTAATREMAEIFRDVGADREDQAAIIGVFRETAAAPPDAATVQRWRGEAERKVTEAYGDEAAQVLQWARQLIARDPRVERMIAHHNRGDHPDVVLRACRLAVRERTKGRLK